MSLLKKQVTNAFRLQALFPPVHLQRSSHSSLHVTNAFRLQALFPHLLTRHNGNGILQRHQCLSASGAFSTFWGRVPPTAQKLRHQCLSASGAFSTPPDGASGRQSAPTSPMPFGFRRFFHTRFRSPRTTRSLTVTNAFRLQALFPLVIGECKGNRGKVGHQCLSASGAFSTPFAADVVCSIFLRHQCLSASGAFSTFKRHSNPLTTRVCHQCLSASGAFSTSPTQTLTAFSCPRHQCLSASGAFSTHNRPKTGKGSIPFVTNAFRLQALFPRRQDGQKQIREEFVTNAFRLQALFPQRIGLHDSQSVQCHQCLSASGAFSTRNLKTVTVARHDGHQCLSASGAFSTQFVAYCATKQMGPVTNAFRLQALFPRGKQRVGGKWFKLRHQCLSASGAFSTEGISPLAKNQKMKSPMPFGFRRFFHAELFKRDVAEAVRHQCLSASGAFSTLMELAASMAAALVTNAFRLQALFPLGLDVPLKRGSLYVTNAFRLQALFPH